MRRARLWQRAKSDAGYAGITWPAEVGGQGGPPIEKLIFEQEEAQYRVFTVPFQVGMGMCLPTIIATTPPELARIFVAPALRGEEIWCQLFSEPGAGSDLAGVRTRAVRDGESWVVNGQKVWTSYANHSDFGLLLLRTDPGVAEAQRPDHVLCGHAQPRYRCAADPLDDRPRRLQRGLSHRSAHSGQPAPRRDRWRLACGAHHADARAAGDRPRPRMRLVPEELIALARTLPSGTDGSTMLEESDVQRGHRALLHQRCRPGFSAHARADGDFRGSHARP